MVHHLDPRWKPVLRCDGPTQLHTLLDVLRRKDRDDLRAVGCYRLDEVRQVVELHAMPQHAAGCASGLGAGRAGGAANADVDGERRLIKLDHVKTAQRTRAVERVRVPHATLLVENARVW